MAWQNPKTDWVANPKNPKAEDFNRIEGNIDFLKTDIGTKKGAIVDASKVLTGTTIAGTAGTMPNRGSVIITPSTSNQTIAAGYHSGSGYVTYYVI